MSPLISFFTVVKAIHLNNGCGIPTMFKSKEKNSTDFTLAGLYLRIFMNLFCIPIRKICLKTNTNVLPNKVTAAVRCMFFQHQMHVTCELQKISILIHMFPFLIPFFIFVSLSWSLLGLHKGSPERALSWPSSHWRNEHLAVGSLYSSL